MNVSKAIPKKSSIGTNVKCHIVSLVIRFPIAVLCFTNLACGIAADRWQSDHSRSDNSCSSPQEFLPPWNFDVVTASDMKKCEELLADSPITAIDSSTFNVSASLQGAGDLFLIRGVAVAGTEGDGYFTICAHGDDLTVIYLCRDPLFLHPTEHLPIIARLAKVPRFVSVFVYRDSDRGSLYGKSAARFRDQ
jgi:hypothetical protein